MINMIAANNFDISSVFFWRPGRPRYIRKLGLLNLREYNKKFELTHNKSL